MSSSSNPRLASLRAFLEAQPRTPGAEWLSAISVFGGGALSRAAFFLARMTLAVWEAGTAGDQELRCAVERLDTLTSLEDHWSPRLDAEALELRTSLLELALRTADLEGQPIRIGGPSTPLVACVDAVRCAIGTWLGDDPERVLTVDSKRPATRKHALLWAEDCLGAAVDALGVPEQRLLELVRRELVAWLAVSSRIPRSRWSR